MGETVKFLSNSISIEMYEAEKSNREYLEKFICNTTIDRIRDLEDKANEANELRIRLEEKEKAYDDLKKSFDDRIKTAVKCAEYNKDVSWQAIKDKSLSDQRKNIRSKEVKPEKERTRKAEIERDRFKEMYDDLSNDHTILLGNQENMLTLIQSVYSIVKDIQNSIAKGGTIEKVSELVNTVSDELDETMVSIVMPNDEDKKQICKEIKQLKDSGSSNKAIAEQLMKSNKWFISMKSVNAAEQKVGRYIKSRFYKIITNNSDY